MRSTEPGPVEILLHWLSAHGPVGRVTLERACSAIAQRFEPERLEQRDRGSFWRRRYAGPLVRMGHVEETSKEGFAAAPSTLLWRADEGGDFGRGTFYGARDERLLRDLEDCFGPIFRREDANDRRAETWVVEGNRVEVGTMLNALRPKLDILDEPGERLLGALPSLEQAILGLREDCEPSANIETQFLSTPSCRSQSGAVEESRTWRESDRRGSSVETTGPKPMVDCAERGRTYTSYARRTSDRLVGGARPHERDAHSL